MTCNLPFQWEAYTDHRGEAICSDGRPMSGRAVVLRGQLCPEPTLNGLALLPHCNYKEWYLTSAFQLLFLKRKIYWTHSPKLWSQIFGVGLGYLCMLGYFLKAPRWFWCTRKSEGHCLPLCTVGYRWHRAHLVHRLIHLHGNTGPDRGPCILISSMGRPQKAEWTAQEGNQNAGLPIHPWEYVWL